VDFRFLTITGLDPVASTTPRGRPARGPRSPPRFWSCVLHLFLTKLHHYHRGTPPFSEYVARNESGTPISRVSDYGRKARASDYRRGGVAVGLAFAFEFIFMFAFEFMFPRPRLARWRREAAGVAGSAEVGRVSAGFAVSVPVAFVASGAWWVRRPRLVRAVAPVGKKEQPRLAPGTVVKVSRSPVFLALIDTIVGAATVAPPLVGMLNSPNCMATAV
jgi:hypothetical protein